MGASGSNDPTSRSGGRGPHRRLARLASSHSRRFHGADDVTDELTLVGLVQCLGGRVVVGRPHGAGGRLNSLTQETIGVPDGQVLGGFKRWSQHVCVGGSVGDG